MVNDEVKELLSHMEDGIRYDINEVSNQLKDMQTDVNILKQQVSNLEKIIRIVDEHVAGGLSGIRIDVALVKGELERHEGS